MTISLAEAVFSRCLSSLKNEREQASRVLPKPATKIHDLVKTAENKKTFISQIAKVNIPLKND